MNEPNKVQQVVARLQAGDRAGAVAAIERLTADAAAADNEWLPLAQSALSLGEICLALRCAQGFLAIDPTHMQRALHVAGVMAEAGRFDKALQLIEPLLAKHPADATLNHFCGTVYQQLGEREQAEKCLLRAVDAARLSGITWLTLAAQHRFTRDDVLMERLQAVAADIAETNATNRLQFEYALGKALLDVEQYDAAFDAFEKGARFAPDASRYSISRDNARVDATIVSNDADSFAAVAQLEEQNSPAIFVVGLPRSGTTLLQRILEANEEVAGGGEFSGMGVATLDLVWAKKANLNALRRAPEGGATDLGLVADLYRRLARERYDTDGLIVDKSINNSAYVGLIAKVFPNAPIVVIERDILDVAWSCFRTCFSSGKAWSWSLENIAAHFLAERKLIEHWRQLVPDRILTLRYEDLVTNPADVVPRLADFCGLEFQQDMLEFHVRKSPVTTASVVQTSEPISDKAIGSAQKVKHRMQPFIDAYHA